MLKIFTFDAHNERMAFETQFVTRGYTFFSGTRELKLSFLSFFSMKIILIGWESRDGEYYINYIRSLMGHLGVTSGRNVEKYFRLFYSEERIIGNSLLLCRPSLPN